MKHIEEFYKDSQEARLIAAAVQHMIDVVETAAQKVNEVVKPLGVSFELRMTNELSAYATSQGTKLIMHLPLYAFEVQALPKQKRIEALKQMSGIDGELTPLEIILTFIHEAGHNLMMHATSEQAAQQIKKVAVEAASKGSFGGLSKVLGGFAEKAFLSKKIGLSALKQNVLALLDIMQSPLPDGVQKARYGICEEMTTWSTSAYMSFSASIGLDFVRDLSQMRGSVKDLLSNLYAYTQASLGGKPSPFVKARSRAAMLASQAAPSTNMTALYKFMQDTLALPATKKRGLSYSMMDLVTIGIFLNYVADEYEKGRTLADIQLSEIAKREEEIRSAFLESLIGNRKYGINWGNAAAKHIHGLYVLYVMALKLSSTRVGDSHLNASGWFSALMAMSPVWQALNGYDIGALLEEGRKDGFFRKLLASSAPGGLYPANVSSTKRYAEHIDKFEAIDTKYLSNKVGINDTFLGLSYTVATLSRLNSILTVAIKELRKQISDEEAERLTKQASGKMNVDFLVRVNIAASIFESHLQSTMSYADAYYLAKVLWYALWGSGSGQGEGEGEGEGGEGGSPDDRNKRPGNPKSTKPKDPDESKSKGTCDKESKDCGKEHEGKTGEGKSSETYIPEIPIDLVEELEKQNASRGGSTTNLSQIAREAQARGRLLQGIVGRAILELSFRAKKFISDVYQKKQGMIVGERELRHTIVPTVRSAVGTALMEVISQQILGKEDMEVSLPRIGAKRSEQPRKVLITKVVGAMGDTSGSMHGYHELFFSDVGDALNNPSSYIMSAMAGMAVGNAYALGRMLHDDNVYLGFAASVGTVQEHAVLLPVDSKGIHSEADFAHYQVFSRLLASANTSSYNYGRMFAADLLAYGIGALRRRNADVVVVPFASYFTGDFYFEESSESFIRGVFDALLHPRKALLPPMNAVFPEDRAGDFQQVHNCKAAQIGGYLAIVVPGLGYIVPDYVGALFVEVSDDASQDWSKLVRDYQSMVQERVELPAAVDKQVKAKVRYEKPLYQLVPKGLAYMQVSHGVAEELFDKVIKAVEHEFGSEWLYKTHYEKEVSAGGIGSVIAKAVKEVLNSGTGIKEAYFDAEKGQVVLEAEQGAVQSLGGLHVEGTTMDFVL